MVIFVECISGESYNADARVICSDPCQHSALCRGSCWIEGLCFRVAGGSRWQRLREDAWPKLGRSRVFLFAYMGSVSIYLSKMVWRSQVGLHRSKEMSMLSSQNLILPVRFWYGRNPWKNSKGLKCQYKSLNLFNHLTSSCTLTSHLFLPASLFPSPFPPFSLQYLLIFSICRLLSSCPSPLYPLSFNSFCLQQSLFLPCRNRLGIDIHGHSDLGRAFTDAIWVRKHPCKTFFKLFWWSVAHDQFICKWCCQMQHRAHRMMVYHWPLLWFLTLPWKNDAVSY